MFIRGGSAPSSNPVTLIYTIFHEKGIPFNCCKLVWEHMSRNNFRGIFVKKANHPSRCVKGTLRNIKNDVGNFVTCTDGHKGGFKM